MIAFGQSLDKIQGLLNKYARFVKMSEDQWEVLMKEVARQAAEANAKEL